MKLHLGCGKRNFGEDWVHIDGGNHEHLHSRDITTLPFKDGTVELVYASHVLEYFDREEAVSILKEWKRVLVPEGTLRIAVPDFEATLTGDIRGKKKLWLGYIQKHQLVYINFWGLCTVRWTWEIKKYTTKQYMMNIA